MKNIEDTLAQQKSIALIRNYLRVSVSSLVYHRHLLCPTVRDDDDDSVSTPPENVFKKRAFCGLKGLHFIDAVDDEGEITSEDGYNISNWLEQGVFPGIENRSVHSFNVVVLSEKADIHPSSLKFDSRRRDDINEIDCMLEIDEDNKKRGREESHDVVLEVFRFRIGYCGNTNDCENYGDDSFSEEGMSHSCNFDSKYHNSGKKPSADSSDGEEEVVTMFERIRRSLKSLRAYCTDPLLMQQPDPSLTNQRSRSKKCRRSISFILEYTDESPPDKRHHADMFSETTEANPLDQLQAYQFTKENSAIRPLHQGGYQMNNSQSQFEERNSQLRQPSATPQSQSQGGRTEGGITEEAQGALSSITYNLGAFCTDYHTMQVSCTQSHRLHRTPVEDMLFEKGDECYGKDGYHGTDPCLRSSSWEREESSERIGEESNFQLGVGGNESLKEVPTAPSPKKDCSSDNLSAGASGEEVTSKSPYASRTTLSRGKEKVETTADTAKHSSVMDKNSTHDPPQSTGNTQAPKRTHSQKPSCYSSPRPPGRGSKRIRSLLMSDSTSCSPVPPTHPNPPLTLTPKRPMGRGRSPGSASEAPTLVLSECATMTVPSGGTKSITPLRDGTAGLLFGDSSTPRS